MMKKRGVKSGSAMRVVQYSGEVRSPLRADHGTALLRSLRASLTVVETATGPHPRAPRDCLLVRYPEHGGTGAARGSDGRPRKTTEFPGQERAGAACRHPCPLSRPDERGVRHGRHARSE